MKRRYFKLKVKLIMLVLLIYFLGCGVLIYQEADKIRSKYLETLVNYGDLVVNFGSIHSEYNSDFIKEIYELYGKQVLHSYDDIGFYSALYDMRTGEELVEDQNFMFIYKLSKEGDEKADNELEDMRILLLDNEFGNDDFGPQWSLMNGFFSELEITGTCDDTFVYLERLDWVNLEEDETYSYIPEKMENQPLGETVSFEEWAGKKKYDDIWDEQAFYVYTSSVYATYGDMELDSKLDAEAKEMCQLMYKNYSEELCYRGMVKEEGIFTCSQAWYENVQGKYIMPFVYVFHPVSIAFDELSGLLFYSIIFVLIIMFIICRVVEGNYRMEYANELNRRELTRGVAHELKTPLAIAKGYIENWDYLDEADKPECYDIMVEEINHMDNLVSNMIDLSNLEEKKHILPQEVDLYEVLHNVLKRMKGTIEERNLMLSNNMDEKAAQGGDFVVIADLEMMRTLFVNFVTNAVKYADKSISICLTSNKKKVKFSIVNDGKRIQEDKINRVWDEFYRTGDTDNRRIGGNGLGLSISKQILILHNARYGCSSEDGRTEFWFEIKNTSDN